MTNDFYSPKEKVHRVMDWVFPATTAKDQEKSLGACSGKWCGNAPSLWRRTA